MNFQFKQDSFEGPLGLLLELIEKERLEISQISLAKVTDDYIGYVRALEQIDPEQLAEFLVVAAQLMLIKSRSLLPNLKLDEEEQGSVEDLEKRLAEYKKIKELAKELKKLGGQRKFIFAREAYLGVEPVFYPPPKIQTSILQRVFAAFLETLPKVEKLAEEKIKKIISLEEKINHIRLFLQEVVESGFSEIVRGTKDKVDIIISFLALLELTKQRFVDLKQEGLFEDIIIKKVEGPPTSQNYLNGHGV